ncbi:MAG TPA: tRNA (adenosine(37)-N6)-threonylcarbamoyltransferase complex dimerization subunit type 1 TsaB [Treponema sp.]|nr:tRNA (adenosine(37)-N6)-threonylcarbamoyltransferase complex dimerization subunit type 1 TsaB [Treponema sp.]
MNALAVDCAVSRISVAAKKDTDEAKITLDLGARQSEKLLPAIDFVMKESGLSPAELDYTAVTLGPGTFTGLRIGLSSLKALNLSHGTALYGIPSLQAYAWPYRAAAESVLCVIEAKEDEYFFQFFMHGAPLGEAEDGTLEAIVRRIDAEAPLLVCGPGAADFCAGAATAAPLLSLRSFTPENDAADSLFAIAEQMIAAKQAPLQDYDGPLYIRKSEAELAHEKAEAAAKK